MPFCSAAITCPSIIRGFARQHARHPQRPVAVHQRVEAAPALRSQFDKGPNSPARRRGNQMSAIRSMFEINGIVDL